MKPFLTLTALSTTLMLAGPAQAQEAAPFLPHPDMVQVAIDEFPLVMEGGAMLSAAQADARARRAGPHEFTLEGEYVYRDTDFEGSFNEWSGGISRGIRLPGKAGADRRIGALGVYVAENVEEDARHQAARTLKNLWMAWLRSDRLAALADQEIASYERQLAGAERQRELGEAADLDVEQLETAAAQARIGATLAHREARQAEVTLQRTFPSLALPPAAPQLPAPQPPAGAWEEWQRAVVENSHEIEIAEGHRDRQYALARRARMDRFADPTVGLRGFSERGGEETGLGISVSIPLGGRMRRAESEALGAQAIAAEVAAVQTVREIEIIAQRDVITAQSALEAWRQASEAVASSERSLARLQRSVELGEHDLADFLIAQRQHFDILRSEAEARATAHDAVLQLQIDAHRIWSLGDQEG